MDEQKMWEVPQPITRRLIAARAEVEEAISRQNDLVDLAKEILNPADDAQLVATPDNRFVFMLPTNGGDPSEDQSED